MLITNIQTHIHTNPKKCDFPIHGTSKHVNSSKSLFQKFDQKTMLSQSYMGKKK